LSNDSDSMSGLTRQTQPFPEDPSAVTAAGSEDATTVVGVGVKRSELARLSAIAEENGVTRKNLLTYALRRFIRKYDAGKLRIVKDAAPATPTPL
jgi:hypothetical protein